ncbi:MAG: DNA-directed RNA polymerase subunit beta, partial [Planctomycetes bacterium]|nr:DNA-directed RNA polymerase subunit beta [Planctomycetota bacterium]
KITQKKPENLFKNYSKSKFGRVFLGKTTQKFHLPDLNKIQLNSYRDFLQMEVDKYQRKNFGLEYLFRSAFPFRSNDEKVTLEYDSYTIEEPKIEIKEAIAKDKTHALSVKATIRLILEETEEIKEQETYICDLPYMTEDGTFIINGAERVVVSQIHRSPGVIFEFNERANLFYSRLIPDKGPWLEFEIVKNILYVRMDRKARIPVTTFFRAMGWVETEKILSEFYTREKTSISEDEKNHKNLIGRYTFTDIVGNSNSDISSSKISKNSEESKVIVKAGSEITNEHIEKIIASGIKEIELIPEDEIEKNEVIINTVERDTILTQEQACVYIYTVIRGSEPSNPKAAKSEIIRRWKDKDNNNFYDSFTKPEIPGVDPSQIVQEDKSIFFNPKNYSLGLVGRYKINKKFNYGENVESECLEPFDIFETVKHLLKVRMAEIPVDDIDHLGNRRIRCVGEQLVNHLKVCFARMQRLAKERITIQDHDTLTPQNLLSIKPVTAGIKEFFGTAQLSQFMDQTNPLAAITHKRRLNALGPGGLTRERAGFVVRDIHYTHYGRMCPIETPEGPNIGLIVSLASYAKINKYGFIETPYFKIKNGQVTDKIDYLSALEEDRYKVTPYNLSLEKGNSFKEKLVPVRDRGDYPMVFPSEVDYMDVSPMQVISISSSLIPFLEHDDANRALMGSNMQRQALPLLFSKAPLVGTGIEEHVAKYSGFCIRAKSSGEITKVDNSTIEVKDGKNTQIYNLKKSFRTNQDTYYNQRPIVKEGDQVEVGDLLSDGPAIDNGELALGRNVLTAFMTWEGYNYEDAILMSEKLLMDDVYTSIHIEELDLESRETKLGKEQITRDIPNISEDEYRELDDDGIIQIGAKVKPGSILVGKVTPKGHTEITPEYKLLHSIFGEKARDVKDTSLRVPHGVEGTVVGIKKYTRENRDDLKPGVIEKIKVYLAKKRKLKEGDIFAGRHGNKGVVARILPEEDMPFLPDGRSVEVVLNPLGVPSRMNIGQIYELVLGLIAEKNNVKFATPVFNGVNYDDILSMLKDSNLPEHGPTLVHKTIGQII